MLRAFHHPIPATRSNFWLLLFICNSIAVQMALTQQDAIVRFSPVYWALVAPALMIPFSSIGHLVDTFKGPAVALLAFLICAGVFHLTRGDFRAVLQLMLLVWVIAWCSGDGVRLTIADLVAVFIASIFLGILIGFTTDLNVWGFLPGNTYAEYGAWRVSFFPHVANTGALALIVFLFLTRNSAVALSYKLTVALCIYFLLFSFVRTVFAALALYLVARLLFKIARVTRPTVLFCISLLLAVGGNVAEMYAVPMLEFIQRYPIASRLLLRGASGLDPTAIYQQLYRPWLWSEHYSMFTSSPDWMGLGTFNFLDHVSHNLLPGFGATGSESFPTRLLAVYGIPTVFFLIYLILQLGKAARSKDEWACACFPAIIFMMMNWGSIFHPTNAFFVLFFLLLKGTPAVAQTAGRVNRITGLVSFQEPHQKRHGSSNSEFGDCAAMRFQRLVKMRFVNVTTTSLALALVMVGYASLFIPTEHLRVNIEAKHKAEERAARINATVIGDDFDSAARRELAELEDNRPAWMIIAAHKGDIVRMKQLIDEGVNVNAQDVRGVTALISAASGLQHEAVSFLLSHGADPSKVTKQGFSAYDFAHNQNDEELAHLLQSTSVRSKPSR